jgi:hypothetical protein
MADHSVSQQLLRGNKRTISGISGGQFPFPSEIAISHVAGLFWSTGKHHSVKFQYFIAELFKNASDDPVSAAMDFHTKMQHGGIKRRLSST